MTALDSHDFIPANGPRKPPSRSLEQVMQALYDSEINASVTWFWDAGYTVSLGDDLNGVFETARLDTAAEIGPWLHYTALRLFPGSGYARGVRT